MEPMHRCHVDGESCEVVAWFSLRLDSGEGLESLWPLLPCQRCREGERTILGLPGTRLGRHERRVLLEAPSTGEEPTRLPPEGPSRAADEALRRAIRKLERLGLVERSWRGGRRFEKGSHLAVRRTIPGDWVSVLLRQPLREGTPIRWSDHLDGILERVRERAPGILAYEFRRRIEGFVFRWRKASRRFPGLVDTPEEEEGVQKARKGLEAATAVLAAMDATGGRQWELFRTLADQMESESGGGDGKSVQGSLFDEPTGG